MRNISELYKKDLEKVHLKKLKFKPVYKIGNKLNNIVKKSKDKLDKGDQHNIVYKIECNNCDANYIGHSKRALKTRVQEHRYNIKKKPKEYNVVTLHRLDENHEMRWDNVKILDKECPYFKRLWSEKLLISSTKDTINVQHDTKNLSDIYNLIVKH